MVKNCNQMLKDLLGKEKYKKLKNFTKRRIKEEFMGLNFMKVIKLTYTNHATLLIICGVRALKNNEKNFEQYINLNYEQRNKCLINPELNGFIEEYSEYINYLVDEIKKKRNNSYSI